MIVREEPHLLYKFIKETTECVSEVDPIPGKRVEICLNGQASLEDLLESFEEFLFICGFYLAENESVGIIREIEERDNEGDTEI
jgi:hypothetical protein